MTIKYGELTIIKGQSKLTSWLSWLTNDEQQEKKSKYIFLFDDGEICDAEEKLLDFNFEFLDSIVSILPVYIEKKTKENQRPRVYFDKKINTQTPDSLSCFNQIFTDYTKYKCDMTILSKYNCIYDCCRSLKPEIFSFVRIKSTEQMQRYQFAYDTNEFTKEEIVYLIHRIFNPQFKLFT